MANMKLKNFEYANQSVKGQNIPSNTDRVAFFESINGYVFLIADGEGTDEHSEKVSELAIERIKYYLVNEFVEKPSEALYNSLVYANGFIYEQARRKPEEGGRGVSLSCLLIRDNALHYCCVGNSRIYFFNGRKVYLLAQGVEPEAIGQVPQDTKEAPAAETNVLLGKSKTFKPDINSDSLSPVNGDIVLLASDGLYNSVNEKSLQKILADQMPTQTKVYRVINLANPETATDNISCQIVSFYNIEYQQRKFIPRIEGAFDRNKPKILAQLKNLSSLKAYIKEYLKQPVYKTVLTVLFFLIIGFMFWDIFLHNTRSALGPHAESEQVIDAGQQEAGGEAIAEDRPNRARRAEIPDDVIYVVKSGDTWGRIWTEFGVCSWFIRNHPANSGQFDSAGNPIAGRQLSIPIVYSSIQRLNPNFYSEFSLEKTGSRCENVNEEFLRNFRQNNL